MFACARVGATFFVASNQTVSRLGISTWNSSPFPTGEYKFTEETIYTAMGQKTRRNYACSWKHNCVRSCASSGNDTTSQSPPFCASADFYSSHNQHSQLCHALLSIRVTWINFDFSVFQLVACPSKTLRISKTLGESAASLEPVGTSWVIRENLQISKAVKHKFFFIFPFRISHLET